REPGLSPPPDPAGGDRLRLCGRQLLRRSLELAVMAPVEGRRLRRLPPQRLPARLRRRNVPSASWPARPEEADVVPRQAGVRLPTRARQVRRPPAGQEPRLV